MDARRLWRNNGLSIVLFALFAAFIVGHALTGHREFNADQLEQGDAAIPLGAYLLSGHFWEVTAENRESEFLQMAAYVLLTVGLFQRGSSESKDPEKPDEVDRDPTQSARKADAPGPVRAGGWKLAVYRNSLSLAFLALFIVSVVIHAEGGAKAYTAEQLAHGGNSVTTLEHMGTARFWFESLQNWQSEFLALLAMVVLSIFLRQQGSPESKPVDAPHDQTGG